MKNNHPICHEDSRSLIVSIDLRVNPSVRIAEITEQTVYLRERIGTLHVSATLAYEERQRTKYINLPVSVTEDEHVRTLSVLFPAGTSVTLFDSNFHPGINMLHYNIDKASQTVTETYGTAQAETPSDIQILSIDFTHHYDDYFADLTAQAQQFYDNGTLFNKPIWLLYHWKKDLTAPNAAIYECLIPGIFLEDNKICFSSPIKVTEPDEDKPNAWITTISVDAQAKTTPFMEQYTEPEESVNLMLYENGDGTIINITDTNTTFYTAQGIYWNTFCDAMLAGNRKLSLQLKTSDSGMYHPAYFNFVKNPDASKPNTLIGTIGTHYTKRIDGRLHYCINDMIFDPVNHPASSAFKGSGSVYGPVNPNYISEHVITRIPLEAATFSIDSASFADDGNVTDQALADQLIQLAADQHVQTAYLLCLRDGTIQQIPLSIETTGNKIAVQNSVLTARITGTCIDSSGTLRLLGWTLSSTATESEHGLYSYATGTATQICKNFQLTAI